MLLCDDAHGTGTLGRARHRHRRGDRHARPRADRDRTFSKTFGGIGGILLGSTDVVDFVKHNARSFCFSASLPVPVVAAAAAILDMLEEDGPALVEELHEKAAYMRKNLIAARLRSRQERHAHHAGDVPRPAQGTVHARRAARSRA